MRHSRHKRQSPIHYGSFAFLTPNGVRQFNPVGRAPNPPVERWSAEETLAARLIVGFNVRGQAVYSLEDLLSLVREERRKAGHPAATFIAQRGIYQHSGERPEDRIVVTEDGGQVIIICDYTDDVASFTREMVDLAGTICRRMRQEEVIVEIQRNGVTLKTYGIGYSEA